MSWAMKYVAECEEDYRKYRGRCRSTTRGDGFHDLWVKLAWINRCNKRKWQQLVLAA